MTAFLVALFAGACLATLIAWYEYSMRCDGYCDSISWAYTAQLIVASIGLVLTGLSLYMASRGQWRRGGTALLMAATSYCTWALLLDHAHHS